MSDIEQEELAENTENEEKPTIEELEEQLKQRQAELDDARAHISKINAESAERRNKLKTLKQEKQDAESAATEYQQQARQYDETMSQLQERLANMEKTAAVDRAIADNGAIPELLRPVLEQAAQVKNGQVVVGDKPLNDYVSELRDSDNYAMAFRGRGQAGAGTRSTDGANGRAVTNSKPRNDMTQREKEAFIKQHGITEYASLPLEKSNV